MSAFPAELVHDVLRQAACKNDNVCDVVLNADPWTLRFTSNRRYTVGPGTSRIPIVGWMMPRVTSQIAIYLKSWANGTGGPPPGFELELLAGYGSNALSTVFVGAYTPPSFESSGLIIQATGRTADVWAVSMRAINGAALAAFFNIDFKVMTTLCCPPFDVQWDTLDLQGTKLFPVS